MLSDRWSVLYIFSFVSHRQQKIAAGKVNVMEFSPESALLRIDHGTLKKYVVWEHLYKIIYLGVQENIVVLNVVNFCVQTKVFGNIKFCCPIITRFVS